MALPVASSALPPDVAVQGWAAITVQVAWTLRTLGLHPRRVLREARDHVLFHLNPDLGLNLAEDRAAFLTRGFVAQTRGQLIEQRHVQDLNMPPSSRWRTAILESSDPYTALVFRHHYGAGIALDRIAEQSRTDRLVIEGARAGLRATIRRIAANDELPLHGWSDERIDRQIARLAAFSPYDSPPLIEVAEGCHSDWVARCPRCERTLRLVRAGALTTDDLEPPVGAARSASRMEIVAIHLHPEAHKHLPSLARALGGRVQKLAGEFLFVPIDAERDARAVLRLAAEVGAPEREHLRAVTLEGPGRWSRFGVLGPLIDQGITRLRSAPWGTIDLDEDLPEPLPPPPSSRWAWASVGALGAVLALAGAALFAGPSAPDDLDLAAEFTPARGGLWLQFTASHDASVLIAVEHDGQVRVLLDGSSAADKARLATGDGSYRLHAEADRVLLVASRQPFGDVAGVVASSQGASDPLGEVASQLRSRDPHLALRVSP